MKEEKNKPHHEEDVIFEDSEEQTDAELEDIEEATGGKIKKLQAKLREAEEMKKKALEDLQRTKADFLNSRKRLEEQLARDRERITVRHIEELLPLKDSFDMAMQDPAWATADEKWRKGVEGIHAQLTGILKNNGVTEIDAEGAQFDPHLHEAVSKAGDGHTVIAVLQKGYKMGDTIIRPARVSVG